MPCTYTGSLEGDHVLALQEELEDKEKILKTKKSALTETTQAACEMSKLLTSEQKAKLSAKTRIWIYNHDKVDARKGK